MYYCAVIVHDKTLSVEKVRRLVGEALVDLGEADGYRERTFDGKVSIPFKEFAEKKDFFIVDDPVVFASVFEDGCIDTLQIPKGFYEIYNHADEKKILQMYQQAFYDTQLSIVDEISGYDDADDLIVSLLEYYN